MKRLANFFWFQFGHWLARHGMAEMSESCYRNAAGVGAAQASFHLAKSLLDRGRAIEAVKAFQAALDCDPGYARAWCGLGAAHRLSANLPAAREAYERALTLAPQLPQALSNLGELYLVQGEAPAALDCFERALAGNPGLMEASANRVAAFLELGRYREAEAAALAAIERFPDQAAMQVNYGNVLMLTVRGRPAVKAFRKALELDPCCAEAHMSLALFFGESHRLAQALEHIEHEILLKGENSQRLGTLALAQAAKKDFAAAEQTCRKALALQPGLVSALVTLGGCHSARGDHGEAIVCHEKALQANPNMPAIASNICFEATYLPGETLASVFERHQHWAQRFELPLVARRYTHEVDHDPGRPLRIGYVSGDFGKHPVGFLLRDVIAHHDQSRFEIHCFSMMREDDDITRQIRPRAFAWHDVLLASDDDVAQEIRDRRIDILVDLAGHTAYNRLASLALKPAPVQATWIGYFHSTGLESIDYFITDPHTSPPGCAQLFSEMPVHLPHTRFCYSPPDYAPEVAPAPVLAKGAITFGSFNRLEKLVDPVLDAWAAVVKGVPGSRLLVKSGGLEDDSQREALCRRLNARGLTDDRFELRGPSPHPEMLGEYGDIDIALDTFPFNGGMTTLEALWMGVPVVTLAGEAVVSRQTCSALANLDMLELAFPTVDAYIAGAMELARNPLRLSEFRAALRPRMAASPLCQPAQFTRDLETLYRRMWQAWCDGRKLTADV